MRRYLDRRESLGSPDNAMKRMASPAGQAESLLRRLIGCVRAPRALSGAIVPAVIPSPAVLPPPRPERRVAGKTVVVMPAYNAAATLERVVRELPAGWFDEVVVVDDASRDDTVAIARRLPVDVVVHERNVGYGGKQKTCRIARFGHRPLPPPFTPRAATARRR
jgi:hypothetical protein